MTWVEITKFLILGIAFGTIVGLFNHWLVWSVMKNIEQYPPAKGRNKLMGRYLIRYLMNLFAMAAFLLHRNTYILIGTAVGLTVLGKILAINYAFFKRG